MCALQSRRTHQFFASTCTLTNWLCASLSNIQSDIAQGTKDLAIASAGVSPYGVIVDGAVKSPISNAVEVVDEAAEAGRGVNSYGTNVDHRLGHELEKH